MSSISYCYVALLDVLGYKSRLERDRKSGHLEFRGALERALAVFSEINETDFFHTAISDTIIIRCARREQLLEFLLLIKNVQIAFLKEKLFVRGGIVYQQHFQSGKVTYSLALAQASELEKTKAVYPRVVIDHNIIEMFQASEDQNIFESICEQKLVVEWNGIMFVNILDSSNWSSIRDLAQAAYAQERDELAKNESAFAKHVWFENLIFSSDCMATGIKRYLPTPKLLAPPHIDQGTEIT